MSLVGRARGVPDAEQSSALDDEHVSPWPGQAGEKALDGVVLEELVERLAALAREVEQPLPNRCADVGDRPRRHCSASR